MEDIGERGIAGWAWAGAGEGRKSPSTDHGQAKRREKRGSWSLGKIGYVLYPRIEAAWAFF